METKVILSTKWIVRTEATGAVIEDATKLPAYFSWLKNFKKATSATLTEIRTCSAMSGVEWKSEGVIDLVNFVTQEPGLLPTPYVHDLEAGLKAAGY